MNSPLILALGEILWDLLSAGKQPGGAPANFAYHAAQLGADARTISAVGNDALGTEMLENLRSRNLNTTQIAVDNDHPTGTVTVSLAAGQPSYTIHENVAWDFIPSSPALLDLAAKADCIGFGTLGQRSEISRQSIQQILSRSRPDALRVFDINLRQRYFNRSIIEESLRLASVLKINHEELPVLGRFLTSGSKSPADLFKSFNNLRLIALTRGNAGSALYALDGSVYEHPGYPADPMVDAIGAGDAFTAALAIGLLKNHPLKQINDDANRLASYVCTQPGATPAIPAKLLRQLAH